MSNQAARAFYEKIQSDPALAKKVAERGAELTDADMVQLAREAGFECSADELYAVVTEAHSRLDDEQLDRVVGGVTSPRDVATGQASGKRQWSPIKV